jgi:hypothetical protein
MFLLVRCSDRNTPRCLPRRSCELISNPVAIASQIDKVGGRVDPRENASCIAMPDVLPVKYWIIATISACWLP